MSAWLSPDEVQELTELQRWTAQCRALAALGIPFIPNAAGRPLVERGAVLKHDAPRKVAREHNWGAIRGKAAQQK